ncbi:MAG: CoA-binding protein, partial [Thermodesulfobacteriota bacterium]|nr:CoA-binding protein [Thermodesulfobacteriota bacterium]
MRQLFYPSGLAIFGVADRPTNLAKNILPNCRGLGYKGKFYPVGRTPGVVFGHEIITDPKTLPEGIDLAVLLVPARLVAETMELCGRKGIRHAIVSSGGFSEFAEEKNQAEKDLLRVAKKYGIRFIGPNCLGIVCANSGLCTPFNPLRTEGMKQ